MSNRCALVDREEINPTIEGVAFGGRTYVLARSPSAVLIWVMGHSWSVNGHQRYEPPSMILLPHRGEQRGGWLKYETLAHGKRLSREVIVQTRRRLLQAFDAETVEVLFMALIAPRRTVIVEGGGGALMPSRYYGEGAYLRWRNLPAEDRGFLLPAAAKARDRASLGYRGDEA